MFPTVPNLPTDLALSALLERLSAAEEVVGILIMGSGGRDALTPSSDWDICVALAARPVPLWLTLTRVENRLAEFYFVLTEEFATIELAGDFSFEPRTRAGLLASWLLSGKIWFDRTGQLSRLRQKLSEAQVVFQPDFAERLYSLWFRINYNLRESERLLASSEAAVGTMFDLRLMIYGLGDIWWGYFTLRKLRWQGEKAALAYLAEHDPEFLGQLNRFMAEPDRAERFGLYKKLAERATEPVGGLWPENHTAVEMDFAGSWQLENIEAGLAFWGQLAQVKKEDN